MTRKPTALDRFATALETLLDIRRATSVWTRGLIGEGPATIKRSRREAGPDREERDTGRRLWMTATAAGLSVATLAALPWLPATANGQSAPDARLQAQLAPRQPVGSPQPITAPGQPGQVIAPPSLGQVPFPGHACAPAEVLTTKTLVSVQCRTPVQIKGLEEVSLFAVGVDDPAFASRVLRVAMSAQVAGYRVKIGFAPTDVSGERIGCQPRTCRLIQTISLLVQ